MNPQNLALVIVDPQYDFCEGGGSLPIPQSNTIFSTINNLKKQIKFRKVIITKDYHPEKHVSFASTHQKQPFTSIEIKNKKQELWPDHCIQGTHGSQIHQLLELNGEQIVVTKGMLKNQDSYSGFGTYENPSQLRKELEKYNIKNVFVVGLAYDFCVGSTAIDAKKHGFGVFIVKEGTKSVMKETEQVMRKKLQEAKVKEVSYEQVLKLVK